MWNACSDPAIGLDVSHYQGIKMPMPQAIALGVQWLIAKTWHGAGYSSANEPQLAQAEAAGLEVVGRYAWLLPDGDVASQANKWSAVPNKPGWLPLTIDFEEPATKQRGKALITTLERAIEIYSDKNGHRPIVYTGNWYWVRYCDNIDSEIAASCPLHLAAYPHKQVGGTRYREAAEEVCGGVMPAVPVPWKNRGIDPVSWQFDGDRGLYLPNGVDVDVNVAAWSILKQLAGLNVPSDTLPAPAPEKPADTLLETPSAKKSQPRMPAVREPGLQLGDSGAATPIRADEGVRGVPPDDVGL